jgi:DNA-binding protein YbaB
VAKDKLNQVEKNFKVVIRCSTGQNGAVLITVTGNGNCSDVARRSSQLQNLYREVEQNMGRLILKQAGIQISQHFCLMHGQRMA